MGQILHCEHFRSSKTVRAQKVIVVMLAPYFPKSPPARRAAGFAAVRRRVRRQLRYIGKICLLTMVLCALKCIIKLGEW